MVCPSGAITANDKTCTQVKRSLWPKPQINRKLCSACGICVHDCSPGALRISMPCTRGDINVYAELASPEKCVACRICEKHCPQDAIVMAEPQKAGGE
jgi:formate hydrogenlyase subunit 6/NADH:ubiquinone oxidoreductase subunit I